MVREGKDKMHKKETQKREASAWQGKGGEDWFYFDVKYFII